MFKKRHASPGTAPATLTPHLIDGAAAPSSIRVIQYDREHFVESNHTEITEITGYLDSPKVTWIHIDGLGDVAALRFLGERFNIHPLALEDVLNTGQRPKIEITKDYLFICAQWIYGNPDLSISSQQVSLFLGENFVITIKEGEKNDLFAPVRERIISGRGNIRNRRSDYLTYALIDNIVDHFFPMIEAFGERIEELEDELLKNPSPEMIRELHKQRRNLSYIRRLIWPLRDIFDDLLHESSSFVSPSVGIFFRDCYDHSVQLMDLVESQKEMTASLMELYHSSMTIRTNDIMRVLTVITSIFIPLTFIVGVYGMNFSNQSLTGEKLPFNMPELYHPLGYIGIMLLMLFIAVAQLLFFRRMKWL